ncbi:type I restriction endonuclease, partial [Enterococcus faecalis]
TYGKEYTFFTDLEEPSKVDIAPFLTIDITNLKDTQITEIAKFHKDTFDIDKITRSASELKYLNKFKAFLSEQLLVP